MAMIRLALLLALALGAFTAAQAARAQSLPQGDYQESCDEIRWRGSTLTAYCLSKEGRRVFAALRDANRCRAEIFNNDGRLECREAIVGGAAARAPAIPRGSYEGSCGDIRWSGSTLVARCQSIDGNAVSAALPEAHSCRGDIFNHDGRLQCRAADYPGHLGTCQSLSWRLGATQGQLQTRLTPSERQFLTLRVHKLTTAGREYNCPGFGS